MKEGLSIKKKFAHRATSAFTKIDIFGHSIALTHNGQQQYKTSFGATVTMCLVFLIIGYMGSEIKTVMERNPTISTTSYFNNLI
jgi:hypothetical protein